MTSPLLALFARSLREDQRQKSTYAARVGLVLLILVFLFAVRGTFGWGNAPGLRFFGTVIHLNFAFILLAGVSHFASAITEEKEEMTLGLLRMTNLNPLSILLGKSTSRLVAALLLLAAQFPFTLLAISLGGVSVQQIGAAYCTLGAFTVLLANLALLASVVCRRTTGAAVLTGLTLIAFFLGVPFLRWVAMMPVHLGLIATPSPILVGLNRLADAVALGSPMGRLGEILRTGYSQGPLGVQVWSNLAVGAACFGIAWAVFDWFAGEQPESSQPRSLVARRTSWLHIFGAGRAWRVALAWKDFYFLAGGKGWLLLKLAFYAVPPALFYVIPSRWGSAPALATLGIFTFWVSLIALNVETWFLAASVFRAERQWKTLSSLAMLPRSMRQIAYQKILGCLPALAPALCYVALGVTAVFLDKPEVGFRAFRAIVDSPRGMLVIALWLAIWVGFLHLVAFLSLQLKRGALPVGIGVALVTTMITGVLRLFDDHDTAAMLTFYIAALLGVSVLLHWKIGRRLEALAEEE